MSDPGDEGCLCFMCRSRYKVDVMVPDDLWMRLGFTSADLVCGECIVDGIERLGEFGAFRLEPVP